MKKIIIRTSVLVIIISMISCIYLVSIDKNEVKNKEKQIKNTNMLTMMLETEVDSGIYEESIQSEWTQEGYVFNENLSKCENGGTLTWDDTTKKVIMESKTSDKCYVYFKKKNATFANYLIDNVYVSDGINNLYYHDETGTYNYFILEAGDNSYRYSGANPNNYVCFGSDEALCPINNTYRIIGIFDDDNDGVYNVKLIKSDYTNSDMLGTDGDSSGTTAIRGNYYKGNLTSYDRYYGNYDTTWTEREFFTVNLNTNYWNYLNEDCQNMIELTTWKVGGNNYSKIFSVYVKDTYQNEIINPSLSMTYTDEIGLMYVSDYGYAASPENWQTLMAEYNNDTNRNNNWLYMGLDEWTITYSPWIATTAFQIEEDGKVSYIVNGSIALRPAFYLKSEVLLKSGTGTFSDPYRLELKS